jgi:serine/threonine protein kinase
MQELSCPACGQRYASGQKRCPKDGTALLPVLFTQDLPTQLNGSKTIQDGPIAPLSSKHRITQLAPGVGVGEYVLQNKLGVGGMGEVWKAQQPTIGKFVAVKVLTPESATSKKSIARFVQEARAVNEIRHPNLVDIFSFGELPDLRPYFVMELLDGKSLGDYMAEKGPLPFADIIRIFPQVCNVLQAAHDKEIVHRDLKPDNIFLINRPNEKLFVKVLDFGIAKLAGEGRQNLTEQGAVFGTPGYMSPEQYEETKNVDHRSDIYSLGVLLFEMLTGRTPFDEPGLGMYELIIRQMSKPAPIPSQIATQRVIPKEIDSLVKQMLAKSAADRPANCIEVSRIFLEATRELKSERMVAATPELIRRDASTMELTSPQIDSNATNPIIENALTLKSPKIPESVLSEATTKAASKVPTTTHPLPPTLFLVAVGLGLLLASALITFLIVG